MISRPVTPCGTHHLACACRENWARQACTLAAGVLLKCGQQGDDSAAQAYVELNEMWLALYGHEILEGTTDGHRPMP